MKHTQSTQAQNKMYRSRLLISEKKYHHWRDTNTVIILPSLGSGLNPRQHRLSRAPVRYLLETPEGSPGNPGAAARCRYPEHTRRSFGIPEIHHLPPVFAILPLGTPVEVAVEDIKRKRASKTTQSAASKDFAAEGDSSTSKRD